MGFKILINIHFYILLIYLKILILITIKIIEEKSNEGTPNVNPQQKS